MITTKSGLPCEREVVPGATSCWQHGNGSRLVKVSHARAVEDYPLPTTLTLTGCRALLKAVFGDSW